MNKEGGFHLPIGIKTESAQQAISRRNGSLHSLEDMRRRAQKKLSDDPYGSGSRMFRMAMNIINQELSEVSARRPRRMSVLSIGRINIPVCSRSVR